MRVSDGEDDVLAVVGGHCEVCLLRDRLWSSGGARIRCAGGLSEFWSKKSAP